MPTQEYALDATGTNRVQIFQGDNGGTLTVLQNGSILGSISNQEELIGGRTFTLKDGSVLLVRLVNNQYQVMREGFSLRPMSATDIVAADTKVTGKRKGKREIQPSAYAKRAVFNGIISLVLSLITLVTLAGVAGIITGTFAIIYGFQGLSVAERSPIKEGRSHAITGIVLGCIGLAIVIISLVVRNSHSAYQ